ncbi:putative ABC transporter permease protein YtcP [Clostridia bacterium]|nr:putative ABC transporter permease protein YtcP [Clostridia bacterium]
MHAVGKKTWGEKVFDVFNHTFLFLVALITLYPLLYVVFASFSEPGRLYSHTGMLFAPLGFSVKGYNLVFKNPNILNGYKNTLFIVLLGTFMNLVMTIVFAYVLSRRNVYWNRLLTMLVTFTMFFSGGLIPLFLVVRDLGLFGSLFSLILPGLISTWYLIIMRTSFQEVPYELEESARIDGANDVVILFRIIVPLSMSVIAVITLFYAAGYWNAWVYASIFITEKTKFPLQLVLREILIVQDQMMATGGGMGSYSPDDYALVNVIKYCTIVVSTVPILFVYPFLQKYFTKGIMIGAVKG